MPRAIACSRRSASTCERRFVARISRRAGEGKEFVIALPSTPLEGAQITAERLRVALETMIILDDDGDAIPITASIGVTEMVMNEGVDTLVDRADQGMYASKSGGRNRVTVNAAVKPPSFASLIVVEQMDKSSSRDPSPFVADAE